MTIDVSTVDETYRKYYTRKVWYTYLCVQRNNRKTANNLWVEDEN